MIKEAVKDKRLARPEVIPIKVDLTYDEKKIYVKCSIKIRNISGYLHTSDPKSITSLLRRGGRTAGLARAWFANVKERKNLVNCAKNKLLAAVDIIATKHPSERIMVFSETLESIQRLKEMLQLNKGIKSMLINSNYTSYYIQYEPNSTKNRQDTKKDRWERYSVDIYYIPITYA